MIDRLIRDVGRLGHAYAVNVISYVIAFSTRQNRQLFCDDKRPC